MARCFATPTGRQIACHLTPGLRPTVAFCGGFKSDMEGTKALHLEAWAKERSCAFLQFDCSGHGQSEGNFSESSYSKQIAEMNYAASFMSAEGVSWLGLTGHSMGAMVALLAAAEMDKVRAVCTLAAKASALHTSRILSESQLQELQSNGRVHFASRGRNLELTEAFFADATNYELSNLLPSLLQPWLIVHGDQDEIIPMEDAHLLQQYRPVSTELAIIKGADHMFSHDKQRQEVVDLVVKWFKRQAREDGF